MGLPLPYTECASSPRVFLIRPRVYDPNLWKIEDVMKVSLMMNDILLREDDNIVVAGQVGILDLANLSGGHFRRLQPTLIKKMTMMGEEGSPIRNRGFHYINTPKGFEQVFNVFLSVMNEKSKCRVSTHLRSSNVIAILYLHPFISAALCPRG